MNWDKVATQLTRVFELIKLSYEDYPMPLRRYWLVAMSLLTYSNKLS